MIDSYYKSEATAAELEERVRRLESAVSALSDTHLMEDRVVDQVVQRLKTTSAKNTDGRPPAAMLAPPAESPGRRYWLPFEIWGEVRTFFRMLGDHRYPFSFWGRFGWLLVGAAYFFAYFFCSLVPLIGWLVERVLDTLLAVILYKVLSREVSRYRAMFPNG